MPADNTPKREITPVTETNPSNTVAGSQAEYEHLLSYFKSLVTLTTIFITLFAGLGAYLFHSNMKDVREDAKQEATSVATSEAKAAVVEAFNEKNINAMILSAAQQKVGTITDKLIEQQLTLRLRPVQERIVLMGRISESEMRMRLGFRLGLDDLIHLIKSASDPDVVRFGKNTLVITSKDFDTRLQEDVKRSGLNGLAFLQRAATAIGRPTVPSNLHDVVQIIGHDVDLNFVCFAFLTFRDLSGEHVKMFDFDSITSWCSQNQGKC
jgi:hypothetical protein